MAKCEKRVRYYDKKTKRAVETDNPTKLSENDFKKRMRALRGSDAK